MWEYRAQLVRVIDGDTVVLLCDTGFNGRQEEHFRLLGVNAPELNQTGGRETKQLVENLFQGVSGKDLWKWPFLVRTSINTISEPTEKKTLTRYLAVIFLARPHTEISINSMINSYLSEHPEWWESTV